MKLEIIPSESLVGQPLPVLASEGYLKTKSGSYGWFAGGDYVLPFFLDRKLIFTRMVFTEGLIKTSPHSSLEGEKEFLDQVVRYVKSHDVCDFIYKAQSNVIFNVCPDGSQCVPWGTYLVDLDMSGDALLATFDGKHRNVIKKAMKDGVVIETTTDIVQVYENIKDTLDRQKSIHYPSLSYLQKLRSNLPDNSLFFRAVKDGQLQGTAIVIFDEKKGFYMYGGSVEKPYSGSLNLLQFEAMKYLQGRGVHEYDLVGARIKVEEGSKYEGIQRFKSRFGARLVQGYAFRTIIHPVRFKAFNILTALYLRFRGYDYRDPIDQLAE